jgi:SAM-dependent methyltransferase
MAKMASVGSEERLQREAQFHDKWAAEMQPGDALVDEAFTKSTAVENRHILDAFGDLRGKRILDYGCGAGEASAYLAKLGATVVGVDVSRGMLDMAQRVAREHGVQIETRVVEGHRIPADSQEFDLLYGNGVLHHVDLNLARPELARVLKDDGIGCFIEPLAYNPAIEVYRWLAGTIRTDDERPLTFGDLDRFNQYFYSVDHHEFWLTTLSIFLKFYFVDRADPKRERYWKKIYTDSDKNDWLYGPLQRVDEAMLARFPVLGRLCWNTVLTVRRPRR